MVIERRRRSVRIIYRSKAHPKSHDGENREIEQKSKFVPTMIRDGFHIF